MPPRPEPATPGQRPSPVRYLVAVLLTLIVIVGLIVLITWLIVQPKKLRYSIEQGSISNFNLTNDRLNSKFHFVLQSYNPNRHISIYYDRIDVTVSYQHQELSNNNVHPFYQRRHNVTHVDLNLIAKNATLYSAVARDLRMEKGGGDVMLDVYIRAQIRLKVGAFKIHRKLKVHCRSVTVPVKDSDGFKRVWCETDID